MKLSEFFIRRKNERWLRGEHPHAAQPLPLAQAKDIGILFLEEEGQPPALNRFVDKLVKDHKRVRALTYFDRIHSHPYQFKFDFFVQKEISMLGTIENEKVGQFVDFPFDYLFCVTRQVFLPFEYILLRSHARFKAGFHQEGKEQLLDLMLEPADGTPLDELLVQLYDYTDKITR